LNKQQQDTAISQLKEDKALRIALTSDREIGRMEITRGWKVNDNQRELCASYLDDYTSVSNKYTPSTTVTNPQVDREEVVGTFQRIRTSYGMEIAGQLLQTLRLVHSVTSLEQLTALSPRITDDNEILEPFGIVTGEADTKAYLFYDIRPTSRAMCMGFTDANLVTNLPGAGWTYVTRKFDIDDAGLGVFIIVFKKTVWQAWGHNSYAPDVTSYDNAGTANEKEQITRTWARIQQQGAATAISDCRTGTNVTPDAGYIIIHAGINGGQDGTVSLVQIQRKQVNNRDLDDEEIIRPHGWTPGTLFTKTTAYEDFTAAGLTAACASESTPVGYVRAFTKNDERGGLRSRYYIYQQPQWDGAWADRKLVAVSSPDDKDEIQTHEAAGIPKTDVEAAFAAVVADAGYALVSKILEERANGEFAFRRQQRKTNDAESALIIHVRNGFGGATPLLAREWYRITGTKLAELTRAYDEGPPEVALGEAVDTFVHEGISYGHLEYMVSDHHESGPDDSGVYTLKQVLIRTNEQASSDVCWDEVGEQKKAYRGTVMVRDVNYRRHVVFEQTWNSTLTNLQAKQGGSPWMVGTMSIGQFMGIWKATALWKTGYGEWA